MKISYECDYALKIILDLAEHYPRELVHLRHIAQRQDIPPKFLEQILRRFMEGGFVRSQKGRYGGYMLTRPPKDITLGQVLRLIEGSLYPIACVDPKALPTCDFLPICTFYDIWKQVGDAITQIVDHVDFEQLQQKMVVYRETRLIYDI